jgi:hypothetical protein
MLTISLTLDSSLLLLQEDLWIYFLMLCFYFLFWARSSAMCLKAPTACHFAFNVDAGVVVKRLQQQHRSPPCSLARSLVPSSCSPSPVIPACPSPHFLSLEQGFFEGDCDVVKVAIIHKITWAPCCCALPVTFNFLIIYHGPIWFSISHYYLYQFWI